VVSLLFPVSKYNTSNPDRFCPSCYHPI